MGPQHPSTHGVLQVKLKLDGERVIDAECVIGYLHRGVEKLGEAQTYGQFVPTLDRMDYIAAVSNCLGYCETIEKMLGVAGAAARSVHPRHHDGTEPHIESSAVAGDTRARHRRHDGVSSMRFASAKKSSRFSKTTVARALRRTCSASAARNTRSTKGFRTRCARSSRISPKHVAEYETLLTENRIWIGRTRGVGVISGKEAIDLGLTGPASSRFRRRMGFAKSEAIRRLFRLRVRHSDRRDRRHLRPVHGSHRRDAPVGPDRRARRWKKFRMDPSWPS